LREDNDLKQESVARILNVTRATYSRYETGDIEIPISQLIRLSKFYDTTIDYLVGMSDEKDP